MARVKQEEKIPDLVLDAPQEVMRQQVIPNPVKSTETTVKPTAEETPELINCLRNERVIVRFIKRSSNLVRDPNHILSGGMARNATRSFVVPRLSSTGIYKNVLTNSEKAFLEHVMGLEKDALSIYRKVDNFWDDSNPMGIGRVVLHKQDNFLDLSTPEGYIKYKILLANKDQIASSLHELEDRPKATYQFVIISENAETQINLNKMDATKRCYMEYGKVEDDIHTLRTLIELLEGRPLSVNTKLDFLQGKVNEYIQRNPRLFLSTITDELLPAKVLIKKAVDAGIIGRKNDAYYLRKDNTPLCEIGEDSTLNNAARYLTNIKHQTLKYSIEAQLNN